MTYAKWTALALVGTLAACTPPPGGGAVTPGASTDPDDGAIQTVDDLPPGRDLDDPNRQLADDPSQLADGTFATENE